MNTGFLIDKWNEIHWSDRQVDYEGFLNNYLIYKMHQVKLSLYYKKNENKKITFINFGGC